MTQNLKQVTKQYGVNLTLPKEINLALVDSWFKEAFEIESEPYDGDEVHQLVHKTQLMIKALLQAIQIPVYYDGEILSIVASEEDSSNLRITLAVGYIHFIADKHYTDIINFSFKAIFWMMQNQINPQTQAMLFKSCLDEVINPIAALMPAGKSRIPVLKVAYKRAIPFIHLGNGVYQLGWGSKARKMDRSTLDTDSAMGSMLSQNKILSANLLKIAGLPAPLHAVAKNPEQAKAIAQQIHYPLVVKPADLDRGEGVSIDIYNEEELLSAFDTALKLSRTKEILIERQVEGMCHRLFIAEEELLYVVIRLPISVQANGVDTIETLIKEANAREDKKAPWLRKKMLPSDALAHKELQKLGLDFNSVPPKESWIPLRNIESTQWGGRSEDMSKIIHPDNRDVAIRAAKLFGLSVAGVDIITSNISKPWHETGAIINEINFAPSFGQGEISKSYIPSFFESFIEKDGRVPLEIFVGDDAKTLTKAREKQKQLLKEGKRCYLVMRDGIEDDKNNTIHSSSVGLFDKILSLLLRSDVDALVVVIQNDALLYFQIPFDKASNVTLVSENIKSYSDNTKIIEKEKLHQLLAML
ncbi:MAG: hypothetical protein PHU40_10090 [Sulfurimonas sp.]|nr:hypothetical protein [Sulfurimonas sp.]